MDNPFHKLNIVERKRILDSAFKVFTDTPYEKASTNQIVKDAGISKGKLFYYFNSKSNLFDYLVSYGLTYIKTHYIDQLHLSTKDFIQRYKDFALIKSNAYEKESHLFAFMSYVYLHESKRLSNENLSLIESYQNYQNEHLKKNIDTSLFREDIASDRVIELLEYSLDGYQNSLVSKFKRLNIKKESMTKHYKEFENFLLILKKIYYK